MHAPLAWPCQPTTSLNIIEHLPRHHSTAIFKFNIVLQTLLSVLSTTGHKPQARRQHLLLLTQIRGSSYFEDTIPTRTLQSLIKSLSLISFLCYMQTAHQPQHHKEPEQEASRLCTVAFIWKRQLKSIRAASASINFGSQ